MQHSAEEQRQCDAFDLFAHDPLRLDRIGDYFGKRAIISDRSGQHKFNAARDAGVHDASGQRAAFDQASDAPSRTHDIDGAHVIFVPAVGQSSMFQVHPEGCPKQRALNIVNGHGVSRE